MAACPFLSFLGWPGKTFFEAEGVFVTWEVRTGVAGSCPNITLTRNRMPWILGLDKINTSFVKGAIQWKVGSFVAANSSLKDAGNSHNFLIGFPFKAIKFLLWDMEKVKATPQQKRNKSKRHLSIKKGNCRRNKLCSHYQFSKQGRAKLYCRLCAKLNVAPKHI